MLCNVNKCHMLSSSTYYTAANQSIAICVCIILSIKAYASSCRMLCDVFIPLLFKRLYSSLARHSYSLSANAVFNMPVECVVFLLALYL
jgi:hypothetical protein